MADTPQTETGTDANALRNNLAVGESKVWVVKSVREMPGAMVEIAVEVEEGDHDNDNCKVVGDFKPVIGAPAKFTRTETDLEVSAPDAEETAKDGE